MCATPKVQNSVSQFHFFVPTNYPLMYQVILLAAIRIWKPPMEQGRVFHSANLRISGLSQRWLFICNVFTFSAIKKHIEVNFNVKSIVQSVYKRSGLSE